MKNFLLFLAFSLAFSLCKSQDTVVLKHHFYTTTFVKSKHIPLLVEYDLTKEMLECVKHLERGKFATDPNLPEATNIDKDYVKSGYDRGHNMPSKDNDCDTTAMRECFYFSNMFPQVHSLNAGVWKTLEDAERRRATEYGKIKVFIGNLGELKKIGADSVVVPEYCWKVFYMEDTNEYECYLFKNDKPEDKDYIHYQTTIKEIEQKSKIHFEKDKAIVR